MEPWKLLKAQLNDIHELVELNEADLIEELNTQVDAMTEQLAKLKKALRFTGKYDHADAILRITAGVGGTEAMDWAGMLERMYLRFCEKNNFKATNIERVTGEEAGIKTSVHEISGANAYGTFKSEHGVHRLVRLSPFNADNLRQTSFALVEILRGKLIQMQQEQHAESIDKLRAGESAKWGQQIRNYVLQPYKLVKDTRTKYEETDTDAVLDGKINGLIDAYLEG